MPYVSQRTKPVQQRTGFLFLNYLISVSYNLLEN